MTGYHHDTHELHELEETILGCQILDVAKNRRNVARTPNNKTNGGHSFSSIRLTRHRNGATNAQDAKKQGARCSMHHLYWKRVATARLYKIVCSKRFLSERLTRHRNGAIKEKEKLTTPS